MYNKQRTKSLKGWSHWNYHCNHQCSKHYSTCQKLFTHLQSGNNMWYALYIYFLLFWSLFFSVKCSQIRFNYMNSERGATIEKSCSMNSGEQVVGRPAFHWSETSTSASPSSPKHLPPQIESPLHNQNDHLKKLT